MQDVSYVRFHSRPLNHQIRVLTQRLLKEVFRLPVLSQLCPGPVIALFFSLSSYRPGKMPLFLSSWATSLNFEVCTRGSRGPFQDIFFPWEEAVTWHRSLFSLSLSETGSLTKGHVTLSPSSPTPEHVPELCLSLWRKYNTNLLSLSPKNPIQKEHYARRSLLLANDQ